MALPQTPKTCVYAGLRTIHLRTLTTTYAPFNGTTWNFSNSSLQPMEFHGFINTAAGSGLPIGFYANVFDLSVTGGTTLFQIGNNAVGNQHDGVFGAPCYQNHAFIGWTYNWFGGSFSTNATYSYNIGAVIGKPLTLPSFNPPLTLTTVPNANTTVPAPDIGSNLPAPNGGVMGSTDIVFTKHMQVLTPKLTYTDAVIDLDFRTASVAVNAVVANNTAWVQCYNPTGGDNLRLLQTDWLTYGIKYAITFVNPPGGLDVNALMLGALPQMGDCTYAGFWLAFKTTVTIENLTFTGFIVAIAPDYSTYNIIQIIPIDATAALWTTLTGAYVCKIDSIGTLFMKNVNFANTIYVSGGSVVRQLPVFPPVPLPSSVDNDLIPNLMRSVPGGI